MKYSKTNSARVIPDGPDMPGKEIPIEEIKELLVTALQSFHDFCEENGLRYYLCGGTLLGAIREKGFIPWDDDVDVFMPRPDYMRFIELTRNGLSARYRVHSHYHDRNYTFPFVKISDCSTRAVGVKKVVEEDLGVFIDVFPIDGLPESRNKMRVHMFYLKYLRRMNHYARYRESLFKDIHLGPFIAHLPIFLLSLLIGRLMGYRFWLNAIDRVSMRYAYASSRSVGVAVWGYYDRERMRKESMEPRILLAFEDKHFFAAANYHEYLSRLYGDYMIPPPPETRESSHQFKYYQRALHEANYR